MNYIVTDETLDRLVKYAGYPLGDLRRLASADSVVPQGIVERWDRGHCLLGWLLSEITPVDEEG